MTVEQRRSPGSFLERLDNADVRVIIPSSVFAGELIRLTRLGTPDMKEKGIKKLYAAYKAREKRRDLVYGGSSISDGANVAFDNAAALADAIVELGLEDKVSEEFFSKEPKEQNDLLLPAYLLIQDWDAAEDTIGTIRQLVRDAIDYHPLWQPPTQGA